MQRSIVAGALLICAFGASAPAQQQQQQNAVAVTTATAERKPVANTLDFVGRVESIDRVEVRARVTGYLEAVLFKEGDLVKAGAPLYRIEKGMFQAAVEQAQGALERSKAAKDLSKIQLERAEELAAKQAGTLVARDQARAADKSAAGSIMTDEANLETARINLGYTDIVSPITGRASRTNITVGNVVGPDSGVLTKIVSQDPMYVTFPVSQREFLRAQQAGEHVDMKQITARLRFADGTVYDQVGHINFVDVTVDRTTDTILARATFPNRSSRLVDGQLVRVNVEIGSPEDRVVVPQAALIADQEGVYVFVVEDDKAVVKRVKTGAESGAGIVVTSGLSGGEQVIVEGLQGVRPGITVRASPQSVSLRG